jgi:hypothetical protein
MRTHSHDRLKADPKQVARDLSPGSIARAAIDPPCSPVQGAPAGELRKVNLRTAVESFRERYDEAFLAGVRVNVMCARGNPRVRELDR